ncbi:hypothetical protein HanRHA438_Chr05g0223121 [Helianthus annuus]|nr:hypothetical protein HanRHA438_Chr05g0223121 [Helianthus annuus]
MTMTPLAGLSVSLLDEFSINMGIYGCRLLIYFAAILLDKFSINMGIYGCRLLIYIYFFFFERPTNSIPSTLGAPTGQTEYSESNPSPPPIPGKTR